MVRVSRTLRCVVWKNLPDISEEYSSSIFRVRDKSEALAARLAYSSTLKVSVVRYFETLINVYRTTRRNIPEASALHNNFMSTSDHVDEYFRSRSAHISRSNFVRISKFVLSMSLAYFPYYKNIKEGLWDHLAVCIPLPNDATQRLGNHVPAATDTRNNRRTIGYEIFCAVRVVTSNM
jgi:hypothetical protein